MSSFHGRALSLLHDWHPSDWQDLTHIRIRPCNHVQMHQTGVHSYRLNTFSSSTVWLLIVKTINGVLMSIHLSLNKNSWTSLKLPKMGSIAVRNWSNVTRLLWKSVRLTPASSRHWNRNITVSAFTQPAKNSYLFAWEGGNMFVTLVILKLNKQWVEPLTMKVHLVTASRASIDQTQNTRGGMKRKWEGSASWSPQFTSRAP